jgi:hypothetical protein
MNAQEIFNTVATHLFAQGAQASSPHDENACMYLAPDGKKCAVGCLITDAEYSPNMENKTIEHLLEEKHLPRFFPFLTLLKDLQEVHDSVSSWTSTNEMRERLAIVVASHNLDDAILPTLEFKDR